MSPELERRGDQAAPYEVLKEDWPWSYKVAKSPKLEST